MHKKLRCCTKVLYIYIGKRCSDLLKHVQTYVAMQSSYDTNDVKRLHN